jgi:hypothetical protein
MTQTQVLADIADDYLSHAQMFEPESPCFAAWARAVAADRAVLEVLAALPEIKRQPNLVFASARWVGVEAPGPYENLRDALLGAKRRQMLDTIKVRSTQTNEVARLACLTPAFASLGDGPLALVELGASAGLNLFPDHYDYQWSGASIDSGADRPVLGCSTRGPVPFPATAPRVAARIGIDINPLDVRDDDATAWLLNLVWPEQSARRMRLRRAVEVARRGRVTMLKGDLLDQLDHALALAAKTGTRPVVFHSATIAYLSETNRDDFHARMTAKVARGDCHWVSLEGSRVLPEITATAPHVAPARHTGVLAIDGQAFAFADLHGTDLHWFAPSR